MQYDDDESNGEDSTYSDALRKEEENQTLI
jgi:hypothetical protein